MKIVFGLYTEISPSSPVPAFTRALSLIYEPVLAFSYNNPEHKISLYQSSAMMKHIFSQRTDIRSLMVTLAKREDIAFISGSYSQSILSLLPPKDRLSQIERMNSMIRHDYGVTAKTAFFYGQIWSPIYISAMKNALIDNVIISGYKATSKESLAKESFVMNELGKRVNVYIIDDSASELVSAYAQGEIKLASLKEGLYKLCEKSTHDKIIFLNADQLIEGATRNGEEDQLGSFITDFLSFHKDSLVLPEELKINKLGYLDSGWYSRDAYASGLSSFNDIFVRNENFRYLFNRYISLAEGSQGGRGNKYAKKEISRYLFSIGTGPLFIHDALCTPLRPAARRQFWANIIDAEDSVYRETESTMYKEYDLEECGENCFFSSNKDYIAVISPLGAAVTEFDYKRFSINILDTRVPFAKGFENVRLKKSFSDTILIDGKSYSTDGMLFDAEIVDKKRSEFLFTLSDESLPFTIIKHYKLRSSTFILDVTLISSDGEILKGEYQSEVYLEGVGFELVGAELKRTMLTDRKISAKTVKFSSATPSMQAVFSSTSLFTLEEEPEWQSQYTSLGYEDFCLFKRLRFTFPLSDESAASSFRLVLRASEL